MRVGEVVFPEPIGPRAATIFTADAEVLTLPVARGGLDDRPGALAPEVALRPDHLFAELTERGCRFDITTPTTTSEV